MENVTLDELCRNIADMHQAIQQMHLQLSSESRALSNFCHELDRRLTRAEERILFFCAIAGAVSGILGNLVSHFF